MFQPNSWLSSENASNLHRKPRSIHASSWPCTRRTCGPQSIATHIMLRDACWNWPNKMHTCPDNAWKLFTLEKVVCLVSFMPLIYKWEKNGVSKVLKLWMCFQLHRARYRSTRGWSKIHGTWLKRACSILQLNRVWKVDFGEFFGHVCFFGVCFLQFLHGKPSSSMFFRHAENWFWH